MAKLQVLMDALLENAVRRPLLSRPRSWAQNVDTKEVAIDHDQGHGRFEINMKVHWSAT